MGDMERLNPNYVIVLSNEDKSKDDIKLLLKPYGLVTINTPGNDKDTCYVFTRIDTVEAYIEVESTLQNLKCIIDHFPLFDNEHSKSWDSLYAQLNPNKFAFPTPNPYQLKLIAEISKNPKLSCYFEFFSYYNNNYLKKLSIIGSFFWLISSKSSPYEFNRYYTFISIGYSLFFLSSWLYAERDLLLSSLTQYSISSSNIASRSKDSTTVFVKKLLSVPIIIFFALALIIFQLLCFTIEIYITQIYPGRYQSILSLFPTVLLSVYVPIFTLIYDKFFVRFFVNFENSSNPQKSTLQKKFVLLFLTNYMPLLITLFLYLPFGHLFTEERIIALSTLGLPINTNALYLSVNTRRHQKQFFYFIFTNQIICYVITYVVPVMLNKLVNKKNKSNSADNVTELTIKNEYPTDYRYWKRANTFHVKTTGPFNVAEGFQKLILQFGFIAMFSTIWPLAPLLVFCINQIVFKTDLWKCFKNSRPAVLPINVETTINKVALDMSPWDDILKFVTWISVIVCGTITFMYEYSHLPGIGHVTQLEKRDHWYNYNPLSKSWSSILLFAVVLEHACIFVFFMSKKYFQEYQDTPMKQSEFFYGLVPEVSLDSKKSNDEYKHNSNEINEKRTDTEIEKINSMQPEQGVEQLSKENVEYRQRNNASQIENQDDVARSSLEEHSSNIVDTKDDDKISKTEASNYDDGSFPSENGTIIDPSVVYCNNFALSDSIVAGATLPPIIPTSKNYHLRFDENGNQISPNPSMDSGMVHNTPTITSIDKGTIVDVAPIEKVKKSTDEKTAVVAVSEITSPMVPPVISVEDKTESATVPAKKKAINDSTGIIVSKEKPSNNALKLSPKKNDIEKDVAVDQKSSAASTHSKHKSLMSAASHKLNKTRKSISTSATHHHDHPSANNNISVNKLKQNNESDDKTKKKKKKKGLFGKLKV
ncbi:Ist2p PWA37_005284 [Arxiozyma heterogenica]|uniref:Anoctamin transmembrane domain-containing protein n=1 Tax=Arxiozyma heterogenica TaxID=278026 RepID=A0AAN7WT57_9SACH|nr:hypothetical protein RI543_000217 [Kazachstania heterogenica]